MEKDQDRLFHGEIVYLYIVYEISKNINISNYPTLKNNLFGDVKLNLNHRYCQIQIFLLWNWI